MHDQHPPNCPDHHSNEAIASIWLLLLASIRGHRACIADHVTFDVGGYSIALHNEREAVGAKYAALPRGTFKLSRGLYPCSSLLSVTVVVISRA